jgi:hypothetical protein
MGIEPMRLMPQISILPIKLFPQKARSGIEPLLIDLQSITLPLCYLFNCGRHDSNVHQTDYDPAKLTNYSTPAPIHDFRSVKQYLWY